MIDAIKAAVIAEIRRQAQSEESRGDLYFDPQINVIDGQVNWDLVASAVAEAIGTASDFTNVEDQAASLTPEMVENIVMTPKIKWPPE